MTKVGGYAIDTSTTLESNKSRSQLCSRDAKSLTEDYRIYSILRPVPQVVRCFYRGHRLLGRPTP
jgi:hypothetical protein